MTPAVSYPDDQHDAHVEARVEWLYREAKDIAESNYYCAKEEQQNPNSEFDHPLLSFEQNAADTAEEFIRRHKLAADTHFQQNTLYYFGELADADNNS